MVMRTVAGAPTSEDVEDLRSWVTGLEGALAVHETVVLHCPQHGDDSPTWCYVEADPVSGTARRRCLACATTVHLLDSETRWTDPAMHACAGCGTSISELVAGLHLPDGEHVEWVVLAARCVDCGRVAGLTDVVVDRRPLGEVLAEL